MITPNGAPIILNLNLKLKLLAYQGVAIDEDGNLWGQLLLEMQ